MSLNHVSGIGYVADVFCEITIKVQKVVAAGEVRNGISGGVSTPAVGVRLTKTTAVSVACTEAVPSMVT